ncbi:MAG: hypothetical protein VYC39_13160 [Myxococcota bacterium]|nr:hypothetical protein [Myxococcota bacterium]
MSIALIPLIQKVLFAGLVSGQLPIPDHAPMSIAELDNLGEKLKARVVYVTAKEKQPRTSIISAQLRDGFGVALNDNTIAIMSLIVQSSAEIMIHGPSRKALKGILLAENPKSRVSLIRAKGSLSSIGLVASEWVAEAQLQVGLPTFALSSTLGKPEIQEFFLTHTGLEIGYEGTPRLNHPLQNGMPVFNASAQCLGFARAGLWDVDKNLLVPAKAIHEAFANESSRPNSSNR